MSGNVVLKPFMRIRLTPRTILYRADSPAEWIIFVSRGVVKAFREMPSGKRRVMAFQRSQQLAPDGIVGEETLLRLSTVGREPTGPSLGTESR